MKKELYDKRGGRVEMTSDRPWNPKVDEDVSESVYARKLLRESCFHRRRRQRHPSCEPMQPKQLLTVRHRYW